jgi:protein-disulfide isomerase
MNLRANPAMLAVAAGVVAAGALVAASLISAQRGESSAPSPLAGVSDTRALLDGIPQQGLSLGSPRARITLEEFADLQCPYCGRFAREVLPAIVDRYVRTGDVQLVFRPLAFVGADSERSARLVVAASRQGRAWQLVDLLYRNQGVENSGWASADFLDRTARALGLDGGRANADAASDASGAVLQQAAAEASSLGVNSTPTLVLRVRGRQPVVLPASVPLDQPQLLAAIDAALKS